MNPDRPNWLREDGTDERLVNPINDMERIFRHDKNDKKPPKAVLAGEIENKYPEFVKEFLTVTNLIYELDLFNRLMGGHAEVGDIVKNEQLIRRRLRLTERFVKDGFGSVENFIEWWQTG